MNRRDFMFGAAGLTVSPSLLAAQTPAVPATKEDVFADFESGTFDGWTLSGNCWTKEPHTATTIPGITGFQGNRFLCTLHPKLGNNATGKAVSREFTIEKPFINFLIGGGNHPGEACLNLVVDGKVLHTETGNGSSELGQKSWDVSQLIGKKAQFEVVDNSKSAERGYVMVDCIRFMVSVDPIGDLVKQTLAKTTVTNRKYLLVPVYFDDTQNVRPHPKSYYEQLIGSTWPGLDHYFKLASGAKVGLAGSQVLNWTHLPGSAASYWGDWPGNGKKGWDFQPLLSGLLANYPSLCRLEDWQGVFFFPNVLDRFGGGGATWIEETVGGKKLLYPVGIMNPTQGHGVWVHEFSHHFGIGHMGTASDGSPVNPFSAMVGAAKDIPPYGPVAPEHIAFHKIKAKWLDNSRIRYLMIGDDVNVDLERLSIPNDNGNPLVIIIPIENAFKKYYTVEARLYAGYDNVNSIPMEGIVIHYVDNANLDHEARLIKRSDTNGGRPVPAWLPGQTYQDTRNGITVSVKRRLETGFEVQCKVTST